MFMTSISLFTYIPIARVLLLLAEMVKVTLHRIKNLVDVPRFPVLFDPVELLSGSKWWWSRIKELYDGCCMTSFNMVF